MSSKSLGNISDMAVRTLNASQAAMNTASHNMANIDVEGATRQKVNIVSGEAFQYGKHVFGSGVKVGDIRRVHDKFLEKSLIDQNEKNGYSKERKFYLEKLEKTMNQIADGGMPALISDFFNHFRQLSSEPANPALRRVVLASADHLIKGIRQAYDNVENLHEGAHLRLKHYMDKVNGAASDLVNMNLKIKQMEISGGSANDMQDQRDLLIRNISEITGGRFRIEQDDNVTIEIGGRPLLHGAEISKMSFGVVPEGAQIKMEKAVDWDVTDDIGGVMKAIVDTQRQEILDMKTALNSIAYNISNAVNAIHNKGFGLTGKTGVDFFEKPVAFWDAAKNLKINQEVRENPDLVAAAYLPNSPGDNKVALAISQLQNYQLMDNETKTLDDYFGGFIGSLGVTVGKTNLQDKQNQLMMQELENIKESYSGISMDEEMADLVRHQKTFNASAKVVQVAGKMMDDVLEMI